jgi:thiamine monophosphate synthase
VVYLTGRPERCRGETLAWLADQGLPPGEVLMRDEGDRRPARLTKVGALRRLARRYEVASFVDDDAAVVEAVRAAGFPVQHARWMPSGAPDAQAAPGQVGASPQQVLFEIQEAEGRT